MSSCIVKSGYLGELRKTGALTLIAQGVIRLLSAKQKRLRY
jgi:hypothetical protein